LIESHIIQAITEIVGPDRVSDDIVVRQAYSRDPHPAQTLRKFKNDPLSIPDLVVLPMNTEEVQALYKMGNRYGLNLIPMGSGNNLTGLCMPTRSRTIIMDLKRMDAIYEINDDAKWIFMQPWNSYARVQTEGMKRGLWNGGTPAAPGTNNIASNCLAFGGDWQTALAYGLGVRGFTAFTWVLPTGDVLRTGSHGIKPGDGTYWNGPGPDLGGLIEMGAAGSIGTVTELIYKLHSWPGGEWPEEEYNHHPPLPANHRVFWHRFENVEDAVKAGNAVCYSGIGIGVNLTMKSVDSQVGEFHQVDTVRLYEEGYYENFWMYTMLAGFSPGQLDYEEKVYLEIIAECNGKELPPDKLYKMDNYNMDCFRSGDFVRWIRYGIYVISAFGRGPLEGMEGVHRLNQSVVEKYDVPKANTSYPWYYAYDRGYYWVDERDLYGDQLDHAATITKMTVEVVRNTDKNPSGYWILSEPMNLWFGEKIGPNFGKMVGMIKDIVDPNDIASPDKLMFRRAPEKVKKEG